MIVNGVCSRPDRDYFGLLQDDWYLRHTDDRLKPGWMLFTAPSDQYDYILKAPEGDGCQAGNERSQRLPVSNVRVDGEFQAVRSACTSSGRGGAGSCHAIHRFHPGCAVNKPKVEP